MSATRPGRLLSCGGPKLGEYLAAGGYRGLDRLRRQGPAWLREQVAEAGLRGRGGAAFPVSRKWETACAGPKPRAVIVNGGEDEPGSLKDRYLLATRPHLVLEGAVCTARAVGAEEIVCYVSGGAPDLVEGVRGAVDEAVGAGFTDPLRLSVVAAPDTYVAGEDSCAVEFVESGGERAQPRAKPPFPAEHGLGGRPTVVSNVETVAHVALIAREGAGWFREAGTPGHPGTLLVTLPAECTHPGVYEVDSGASFRDVLEFSGGGPAGAPFRGAQVGGPAAGWLPASAFGVALDPDAMVAAGSMLGCAAVRLLPADRCAVDAVAEVEAFFAAESCGKCPLCRASTQFFDRVCAGLRDRTGIGTAHLDKAFELAEAARTQTDCALARFPAAPLRSARALFPDDFEAHLAGRDCGRGHAGSHLALSAWPPPWMQAGTSTGAGPTRR